MPPFIEELSKSGNKLMGGRMAIGNRNNSLVEGLQDKIEAIVISRRQIKIEEIAVNQRFKGDSRRAKSEFLEKRKTLNRDEFKRYRENDNLYSSTLSESSMKGLPPSRLFRETQR